MFLILRSRRYYNLKNISERTADYAKANQVNDCKDTQVID
jgi:hypothetical protein